MRNSYLRFIPFAAALIFGATSCSWFWKLPDPDAFGSAVGKYDKNYSEHVQSVFNKRCVVCHGCYDAPCQLKLSSFAGVDRGASKLGIYSNRLISAEPTRLFIDAQTTREWREKDFFPVVTHYPNEPQRNLDKSILYQLVAHRQNNPLPDAKFDSANSRSCVNPASRIGSAVDKIEKKLNLDQYKYMGMPFGLPALSDKEFLAIKHWVANGAYGPPPKKVLTPLHLRNIKKWEAFLNGDSPKQRLVARYLYEHLFLGHLYFENEASSPPTFFQLVRSKTVAPQRLEIIPSELPYSDPDTERVYYRFQRIASAIVRKNHIVYPLSNSKLKRIEELFLQNNWDLAEAELPGYDEEIASNPFRVFAKIPASARYQFLLDNSEFFVMSFIRGPVCRGQIALDVINDHFFMFFLAPHADASINYSEFFEHTNRTLALPFEDRSIAERFSDKGLSELTELFPNLFRKIRADYYPRYKEKQLSYLAKRDQFYSKHRPNGFSIEDIWDGDGNNHNAVLTIYRHFNNAEVAHGAIGGIPKTALVVDFPIFERMYYNLVANFNIFGPVGHQLVTRLYFNNLRIEGENTFLDFLPLKDRNQIRKSWYIGAEDDLENDHNPLYGATIGKLRDTQVAFKTNDPKTEFIRKILNKHLHRNVAGPKDHINDHPTINSTQIRPIKSIKRFERELRKVTSTPGAFVSVFPDVALLRLTLPNSSPTGGKAYTIIRNRAHKNVQHFFREGDELDPDNDTLNIAPGYYGSFPNLFFRINLNQAQRFLTDLRMLKAGDQSFARFVKLYGIRRNDDTFWEMSDWFNDNYRQHEPIESGIIDLNRYANL
jgi:hypothetical protein